MENISTKMLTSCDIVTVKYITRPIKLGGHTGRGRDAMLLLKHKILKSILLRRTKVGRSADLALPPKMVTLIISHAVRHQNVHI